MTEMPRAYKDIALIRAMEAREFATVAAAMHHNIAGRHRTVLGILADGEFKERKKLAIPAMNKMRICENTLNSKYMIWFKQYWRLRNRYEIAGRARKIKDLDRDILFYEPSYRFFQSEHNDGRMIIDSIYNQPGMLKSMMGAEQEEGDKKQGMLLLASPERMDAKHKAEKMMEKKVTAFEEEKPFKFPSFQEALEIARSEVEAETAKPEAPKPIEKKRRTRKAKTKPEAKKKEPPQKPAKGITSAF